MMKSNVQGYKKRAKKSRKGERRRKKERKKERKRVKMKTYFESESSFGDLPLFFGRKGAELGSVELGGFVVGGNVLCLFLRNFASLH